MKDNDKRWGRDTLPRDAKRYFEGDEPFAFVGDDSMEPDAFFLRDDSGTWHRVDVCDFYAVFVWRAHGAELAIEEVGDRRLSAWFHETPDGPRIGMPSLVWPDQERAATPAARLRAED